ncbi:MAG: dipeptidase [Acidobacteria bacterium]|nr:dipeptidase [Acidobacteriota bacterium]
MLDKIAEARALHARTLVIDTHADTPQRFRDERWNFTRADLRGEHLSLVTAKAGGLDAEFFAAWVEPTEWRGHYAERTRSLIHSVHEQVECSPNEMALCTSADEIDMAYRDGKFAALIGIEGGHSIEARIDLLEEFYANGVRYMTLTWSNNNEWADSSGDTEVHGGLTAFGRTVVRRMNDLGMMVDVSHVSNKTFWDVMKTSTAPVIASHSSCRALTAAPRNLTDQMMRAIADAGGAVMINFFPAFIDEAWRAAWNALRDERSARHREVEAPYRKSGEPVPFHVSDAVDREFTEKVGRAPFASLIDHFDHALQVIGPDHVGIGTDFDGIPTPPAKIDSAADLPLVTAALLERGYSEADLTKVLGANLQRVFRAVEAAAVS